MVWLRTWYWHLSLVNVFPCSQMSEHSQNHATFNATSDDACWQWSFITCSLYVCLCSWVCRCTSVCVEATGQPCVSVLACVWSTKSRSSFLSSKYFTNVAIIPTLKYLHFIFLKITLMGLRQWLSWLVKCLLYKPEYLSLDPLCLCRNLAVVVHPVKTAQ